MDSIQFGRGTPGQYTVGPASATNPTTQPLSTLAFWLYWVLITSCINILAWIATWPLFSASAFLGIGMLVSGLPFVIGSFFLGSAQRGILRRSFQLPNQVERPFGSWKSATAIGYLAALLVPGAVYSVVVPIIDPTDVATRLVLIGGVVGVFIGACQGAVLYRHWSPAWPLWAIVNTFGLAIATLVWWLVFALVRTGGPPTPRGWIGVNFYSSDIVSIISGGAAGTLVFSVITATGLVWLRSRIYHADTGRDLTIVAGLTSLVLLAAVGLGLPMSADATRTVTTILNPHQGPAPTPTVDVSVLGLRTQKITSNVCGSWYYALSPLGVEGPFSTLSPTNVEAVSDNEAWAISDLSMLKWKDNTWSPLALPDTNQITSLEVISPDDAWVVGDAGSPWSAHWNGLKWSNIAVPDIPTRLNSVDAISSDDVWAVGFDYNAGEHPIGILHWDGKEWKVIENLEAGEMVYRELYGVAAISPSDVWAVGHFYSSDGRSGPLTIHWDGSKWSVVPSPTSGALKAVAAVSSDDVWAVGSAQATRDSNGSLDNQPLGEDLPLVLHWDGKEWKQVSTEQLGRNLARAAGGLKAVIATSATDIWAAGYSSGALLLHWDGTTWSVIPSPNMTYMWNDIAVSGNTLWAVGSSTGNPMLPIFGRFIWEKCPGPTPPTSEP